MSEKSPYEDGILILIALGLIFGLAWLIWISFQYQLTDALRWVRVAEMEIMELFVDNDFAVAHPDTPERVIEYQTWKRWLPNAQVEQITPEHLRQTTYLTMTALKAPIAICFVIFGLLIMFLSPGTRYRRMMNLEQTIAEQAKTFPAVAPFVKFDPREQVFRSPGSAVPRKLPLFAEALSPEEWVAYNKVSYSDGKLNRAQATKALVKQLGKRWRGPRKLPFHAQALFAACALKYVRQRKKSQDLINQLALSWDHKTGFRPSSALKKTVKSIIADPKTGGALARYVSKHAYMTTAMMGALAKARAEGGVLAPAEFLWLRGHDRALWYPLNNVGRKSFHAEAMGAMSHYNAELVSNQRIPSPKVEEAIESLEKYLSSPSARSIPPLA